MAVVDRLRTLTAQCMLDQINYMGAGVHTNSTPTTPEMTGLVEELVRVPITNAEVVGNAIQYTAIFRNLPPCEITEMGLFVDQMGQTLVARWLTSAVKPNKNNEYEVTWTLQLD